MNRVWINTKNRRYYRAVVQQDLLGDWTITRSWGSLDSDRGQIRKEVVENETNGLMKLREIEKRRLYRGYTDTKDIVTQ